MEVGHFDHETVSGSRKRETGNRKTETKHMALKLGKVQAKAKAATANNYGTIKEGESLFALVPVNGVEGCGTPTRSDGVPWTVFEILGGDNVWGVFKRIVMPLDQSYCQDQLFLDAARGAGLLALDENGDPIVGDDGLVQFTVNSVTDELVSSGKLTTEQVEDARQSKFAWVAAKVAWRLNDEMPWAPVFEKTQVYTVSDGSASRPAPHRIFLDAIRKDADGVIGNLDAYFDARKAGENPDAPTITLVKVKRAGSGMQNTAYSGGPVQPSDVKGFEQYLDFVPSDLMLDDMFGAVQPGAYANPHTFAATGSIPSQEEIDRKIHGKGEEGSKRSEMAED
jgi:hypothetical protein